jgi:hypothetical protein
MIWTAAEFQAQGSRSARQLVAHFQHLVFMSIFLKLDLGLERAKK